MPAAELDRQKLITLMVGRELTHMFPKEDVEIGEVVMSVRGLTRRAGLRTSASTFAGARSSAWRG